MGLADTKFAVLSSLSEVTACEGEVPPLVVAEKEGRRSGESQGCPLASATGRL